MFGRCIPSALPAAARALEPVSLEVAEEARKKTHKAALAGIGNSRLEKFHEGDKVWVQNRITGVWDKDAVVLGQRNGGASISIYFPDSEKISRRNVRFLLLKKSAGEIPESDEGREFANSPPSSPIDRVSSSFDSHPLRRNERIRQKNKVNKLEGIYYSVRFAKEVTVFHFDSEDVVKCNFVFPDGWRQQHLGEEEGAHHRHLDTDDGQLLQVPHSRDPHVVHWDRHGAAAPGGRGGPLVAVVGPAAARQEDVAAGGVPRPGLQEGLPVPASLSLLLARRPVLDAWGGRDRRPVRGAALGRGWPPFFFLPPAVPLEAWASPAVASLE